MDIQRRQDLLKHLGWLLEITFVKVLATLPKTYCWWVRNPPNQLIVYLIIYMVLYIPDGCLEFLPSTVPPLKMLLGRLFFFAVSAYFQDMFLTLVRVIWVIPALCWVETCSILLSPTTVRSSKNSHASLTWIIYPWTPKPWKMKVLHPQNMGYNPKKSRLSVPMVYYMHIIPGIKFAFVLMGKCRPEMLQQLPFKTWFRTRKVIFLSDTTSFGSNPQ